mmetsp:Transcript_18066/g.41317  ORF Transcript_18066/g.41317 Transcript_18066/m.41317 type:complete len:241 (-) Transcript_18066:367-1089(-)
MITPKAVATTTRRRSKKYGRCPRRRRHNTAAVVALVSLLQLVLSAVPTTDARQDAIVLPAVRECDPEKEKQRTITTIFGASSSYCEPGSRCVANGGSSIGGYCMWNDQKPDHMQMLDSLSEMCFLCGSSETSGTVTSPNDKVGTFTCGELEKHGREGSIPETNCQIFRHMIESNNLCGCSAKEGTSTETGTGTTTKNDPAAHDASDEDEEEEMDTSGSPPVIAAMAVVPVLLSLLSFGAV